MEGRKLEKAMIFYSPGKSGIAFTYAENNYVTHELLKQMQEHLEYETEDAILYIEERRAELN